MLECAAALSVADVINTGNATVCLSQAREGGTQVLACLKNRIEPQCISALPESCANLAHSRGNRLQRGIPACKKALGPYLTSPAQECLLSGFTDGEDLVNCLVKALFT